jgi:hypothetical protein
MLRSGLGAAALYAIKSSGHRILIPDILREEVTARVAALGKKSVSRVESELSNIQATIGSKPKVKLPQQAEFEHAAGQRWAELAAITEPFDASIELMRSALSRVIAHRAPGGEKEQFRDALLWEIALAATATKDVHFVTEDTDFSVGGKLRPELAEEATQVGGRLNFYPDLGQLLRKLVPTIPPISVPAVTEKVLAALGRHLGELRQGPVFDIGGVTDAKADAYATEKLDTLAVTFDISLAASRRESPEIKGLIEVRGECMYDVESGFVFDVRPEDIVFRTSLEERKIVTFFHAEGYSPEPQPIPYRVRRAVGDLAIDS